mmetsp:Transcript_39703/g.99383  ORF Transcript_39703/g.99383 Transcript_39703/m.99383 type:complete len:84 (+) Transcript_39703:841-1092(+)
MHPPIMSELCSQQHARIPSHIYQHAQQTVQSRRPTPKPLGAGGIAIAIMVAAARSDIEWAALAGQLCFRIHRIAITDHEAGHK